MHRTWHSKSSRRIAALVDSVDSYLTDILEVVLAHDDSIMVASAMHMWL